MKFRIEYCVVWNYEPRALRARDRLMAKGATEVELVKGGGGVFEITADGASVFSKRETGRFPTDEDVDALIPA